MTSKVTLDDVYETLKKLEEVEQFPMQRPLEDNSGNTYYSVKIILQNACVFFHRLD